jgi:hypothetical protein
MKEQAGRRTTFSSGWTLRSRKDAHSVRIALTLATAILAMSSRVQAGESMTRGLLRSEVTSLVREPLTRCEERLVDAVAHGVDAWCGNGIAFGHPSYDATQGRGWGMERILRASVIRAIVRSRGAAMIGPNGIAVHGARIIGQLNLARLSIPFPLVIDESYIEQEMELSSAELRRLQLVGTYTHGLVAENLKVTETVDLAYGFRSDGPINLVAAVIGGFLSFDGATLHNPGGAAIMADRLRVKESVFFRSWDSPDGRSITFTADGEVRLINASIQGDLNAHGGTFRNPGNEALDAQGATIGGNVFLDRDDRLKKPFTASGQVVFLGTQIGRSVYLTNARFEAGSALILQGATISGAFVWIDCTAPATVEHVTLSLRDASAGAIADRPDCWPAAGNLHLDGFRYRRFSVGPRDAVSRLTWLRRQPVMIPDPYQQLARVLVDAGDPAGARDVLINLEFDRRAAEHHNFALRLWNWVMKLVTGYGYAAWRAVFPAAAIITLGWILFQLGFRSGLVTPSDSAAYRAFEESGRAPSYYPRFSGAVYSLDTFLPVITFGQKTYWMPNANRGAVWVGTLTSGWFLRLYLWIHIAFGWLLTTLVVAGLTGLLRSG